MAEYRTPRHQATVAAPVLNQTVMTQNRPANDMAQIDLIELFFRLLEKWKLIACAALLGAVIAGVYTQYYVTPMYRASSTIYVVSPQDSVINMSDLQLGSALAADYLKVFNMWEIHEQVISNLDLPYSYGYMSSMLSVSNPTGTRMLDISITSPHPEEAAMIANEYANVVSAYIEETMSTARPNLMSTARIPSSPISPQKSRNIMMGFLLGAALVVGLVVMQTLLDDKYKTSEDIRHYAGLPILAVVPVENADNTKKKEAK